MPLPKSASIAARATEVYTEACHAVISLTVEPRNSDAEEYRLSLPRLLPYLRQLLTCCACAGLLEDAMISVSCGHCYCYNCQFTPPLLKIQCRQCRERTGLVMERHLRLVVDCYKKICIILGDHLTKTGRPIDKEPSAEDSTFDPLQELAKEVASGVKVSRAVLMVIPPDKYINARNSSHVTPKEDVSIIGLHASPTSVGRESSSKQSRFSKREKSATVHSLSFGDDPAPLHTNGEKGHTPVVHSEENSPVVSNNVKSHTRSPQPAGGRVRNRHRSGLSKYSSAGSKTLEPSGEEISEGSSDEKLSLCDSPPRQKPKPLNCRCGTNNPVSLDKICVRAKCPCFSSNVGCKDCHCKHCKNPYNAR